MDRVKQLVSDSEVNLVKACNLILGQKCIWSVASLAGCLQVRGCWCWWLVLVIGWACRLPYHYGDISRCCSDAAAAVSKLIGDHLLTVNPLPTPAPFPSFPVQRKRERGERTVRVRACLMRLVNFPVDCRRTSFATAIRINGTKTVTEYTVHACGAPATTDEISRHFELIRVINWMSCMLLLAHGGATILSDFFVNRDKYWRPRQWWSSGWH